MYKPSSTFRPHEIRVRAHLVLRVTVAVGAVSCVSHPRVVGVEHILPALRINHAVVQEIVGQVVACHAKFLRHHVLTHVIAYHNALMGFTADVSEHILIILGTGYPSCFSSNTISAAQISIPLSRIGETEDKQQRSVERHIKKGID